MAIIEEEYIDSWFDLALRVDDYFTHYQDYIFRGQADAKWALEPTLSRAIKRVYPDDPEPITRADGLLDQFKSNLRGRCSIDLANSTTDEIWALGQHHGLATPLLDFTRSPYAAIFFALMGDSESKKRCIWALLESDVTDFYNSENEVDGEKIRVVEPLTHHNARLVSQRGLFLIVPPGESIELKVKGMNQAEHVSMYKLSFPDSIRDDALAALNLRNINFATLFPDMEGASKQTNYEFELPRHLEKMRETGWPEP